MTKPFIYKLYVSDGCDSCQQAIDSLNAHGLAFQLVNLSEETVARPEHVIIVPALFRGEKLVAYGPDIEQFVA
ncbi:MAG: glutaredoxin domain-containing protein [Bacteroidota bacterium]